MTVAAGMPNPNDPKRGRGFLREEDLRRAEELVKESGMDIATALISMKLAGERECWMAKAQAQGIAFVDLDRISPDPLAISTLPLALIQTERSLPVKRRGNTLWIAFDEIDIDAVKRFREATGFRIIPVMCAPAALDKVIRGLGRLMEFEFFRRQPNPEEGPLTEEQRERVEERSRMSRVAMERGLAFVDLTRIEVSPRDLSLVPIATMIEHCVLPAKKDGKTLWLAMPHFDEESIRFIGEITGLRIIPFACTQSDLDEQIRKIAP